MSKSDYLHGFDQTEQNRLLHQARFLEPYVYEGVDLEFQKSLLEVGCGVGAQTKILCRRFPDLKITGIDLSSEQLGLAKKILAPEIKSRRVRLLKKNAMSFVLPGKKFDAAFLCWFLEHVPEPLKALVQVRKHLKAGAKIYCSEVFNQTLFMEPYSPHYLKYWFEFNDLQWSLKGHPFVGAQLGHLLKEAGFKNIHLEFRPFHFDSREPQKRAAFTDYFFDILMSAQDKLIQTQRVNLEDVKKLKKEVEIVKKSKNSVFFYSFVRATATA